MHKCIHTHVCNGATEIGAEHGGSPPRPPRAVLQVLKMCAEESDVGATSGLHSLPRLGREEWDLPPPPPTPSRTFCHRGPKQTPDFFRPSRMRESDDSPTNRKSRSGVLRACEQPYLF